MGLTGGREDGGEDGEEKEGRRRGRGGGGVGLGEVGAERGFKGTKGGVNSRRPEPEPRPIWSRGAESPAASPESVMPDTTLPLAPMTPHTAIGAFSYLRAVQASDFAWPAGWASRWSRAACPGSPWACPAQVSGRPLRGSGRGAGAGRRRRSRTRARRASVGAGCSPTAMVMPRTAAVSAWRRLSRRCSALPGRTTCSRGKVLERV